MKQSTKSWYLILDKKQILIFKNLVQEIHRINKAWHCFEIANRLLDAHNTYFESYYLSQKNILQKKLEESYSNAIEIIFLENETNPSIVIKKDYQFEINGIFYKDACHKINEEAKNVNDSNKHI